jgi:hypothetical protein
MRYNSTDITRLMRFSCFPTGAWRLLVLGLAGMMVAATSGCSMYPFGHSRYPDYYGGHGSVVRSNLFVPREVQRGDVAAE